MKHALFVEQTGKAPIFGENMTDVEMSGLDGLHCRTFFYVKTIFF